MAAVQQQQQQQQPPNGHHTSRHSSLPHTDLSYDVNDSETSLLRLVYWIRPKWREHEEELKIIKFTEGITNTLLRVSRHVPGASESDADRDAILMRAYGNGTDLIIDRNREATSHGLLARKGMAPPLLGRFQNGLLYGFIPGKVCKAEDLATEPIWRGVAQRLAEWHARVSISGISTEKSATSNGIDGHVEGVERATRGIAGRRPVPNVWSVMQKWIDALDLKTEKQRAQKTLLQSELERSFHELDNDDGPGEHGFVFAHCDLLCANVIQIESQEAPRNPRVQPVTFIDYEYATPAPAAFDIANHFAEFVGYDCDYSKVPGRSIRRGFIREYIESFERHSGGVRLAGDAVEQLYDQVERWRGIPGLYWGIWSLIQARISQIDFDYTKYAEERLSEYFAWRGEHDGSRAQKGEEMPLRERTWASD